MHKPRHFRKSILLSLALLAAASATATAQKADAWARVEPPGVGFAVLMPEKPKEEVERPRRPTPAQSMVLPLVRGWGLPLRGDPGACTTPP